MNDTIKKLDDLEITNDQPTATETNEAKKSYDLSLIASAKKLYGSKIQSKGNTFEKAFFSGEGINTVLGDRQKNLTAANSGGTKAIRTGVSVIAPYAGFYEPFLGNAGIVQGSKTMNFLRRNSTQFQAAVCGTVITNEISDITNGTLTTSMLKAIAEACEEVIDQAETPQALMSGLSELLEIAKDEAKDALFRTSLTTAILSGGGAVSIAPSTITQTIGTRTIALFDVIARARSNGMFKNGEQIVVFMGRKATRALIFEQSTTGEFLNNLSKDDRTKMIGMEFVDRGAATTGGYFADYEGAQLVMDPLLPDTLVFNATTGVITALTGGTGSVMFAAQKGNWEYARTSREYISTFMPETDYSRFEQSEITLGAGFSFGNKIYVPSLTTYFVAS